MLDSFPRVRLAHAPTPLEPLQRLHAEVGGPRIWLKRDDCTGLAFGGNKTRKLEFLLGAAIAAGATRVVTVGSLQSNHARQTAAACAATGLGCDLVLTRSVAREDLDYVGSGNRLLDPLLGATVHEAADRDEAASTVRSLLDGGDAYFIPLGGSDAVGALGYVAAGLELAAQLRMLGLQPSRVVCAASSCGTAAGLAVGIDVAGADWSVDAVAVSDDVDTIDVTIARLVAATATVLDRDAPGSGRWTVRDAIGDAYGIPTPSMVRAVRTLAATEGVLLDPVYTGKAFGDVLERIDAGALTRDDGDIVFVHTGGAPGLFAYRDSFAGD